MADRHALTADQLVVLRAMGSHEWCRRRGGKPGLGMTAWQITTRTPDYRPPTASGRAQPFGERRTIRVLRELREMGLVRRRRSWAEPYRFWLEQEGEALLDG